MVRCIVCERRPAKTDGFCAQCISKLDAQRLARVNGQPKFFLTYKGDVVGLFGNGDGKLAPRLLKRSPGYLPKRKTLDLNRYCEGYTRETIKAFKTCVKRLALA